MLEKKKNFILQKNGEKKYKNKDYILKIKIKKI